MRFPISKTSIGRSFTPITMIFSMGIATVAALAFAERTFAQEPSDDVVLATVDGQGITAADVERELALAIGERKVQEATLAQLRKTTLEQLVKQRLIVAYLAARKLAASEQDVNFEVEQIRRRAEQRQTSFDDYLRRQRLTEDQLRARLKWQISWQRYLDRYLTDQNLEGYFDKHRRHFDGSTLHVAHILLKPERADDPKSWEAAEVQATKLAAQIRGKEYTFADAARQFSQSPTSADGGDIGFIARHEPMPESFSRAAFDLDIGDVSPPIRTPFGVHLVTVLEITPGKRTWSDARGDLERAVTEYLFEWCARQGREAAKVDYKVGADYP